MPPRKREVPAAGRHRVDDDSEVEYVGVVTRDVEGKPVQKDDFRLLLPEGASDADKAAAWNNNGELPPESRIRYYKLWNS